MNLSNELEVRTRTRIKHYMKLRGKSANELAKDIGVSRAMLSRALKTEEGLEGERGLTLKYIDAICRVLEVPVSELFRDDPRDGNEPPLNVLRRGLESALVLIDRAQGKA